MNDTVVTSEGWFSRMGKAFGGMLIGFLMFVAAFPVLFINEGRAVHRAQDLEEGAKNAIDVDPTKADPSHEGKLVFADGFATTEETLSDPVFLVEAPHALKLNRHVEMYQWKERKDSRKVKQMGGGERTETTYHYSKVWDDSPIQSSSFHTRTGHENPANWPFPKLSLVAGKITMGVFTIPEPLKHSLSRFQPLPADPGLLEKIKLPEGLQPLKAHSGGFYRGSDPGNPVVGDVRITFKDVPAGDCALVGVQTGDTFAAYTTRGGRELFELRSGKHTEEAFFKELVAENNMFTWILRAVGTGLMFFGLLLLFKPISVMGDFVPLFGNLLGYGIGAFAFVIAMSLSLVTIGIGWLTFRPLLGIGLLVAAVSLVTLLAMFGRKRTPVPEVLDV